MSVLKDKNLDPNKYTMKASLRDSAACFEEAVKASWKVDVCEEEPDLEKRGKLLSFLSVWGFFVCFVCLFFFLNRSEGWFHKGWA